MHRTRPALKDVEFDRAPFGVTGFETALALGLELVHSGKLSLMRLVELFTAGPARVLGMKRSLAENEPADLTIFSTDRSWTFRAEESASKSRNSPFDGRDFDGRNRQGPVATLIAKDDVRFDRANIASKSQPIFRFRYQCLSELLWIYFYTGSAAGCMPCCGTSWTPRVGGSWRMR